MGILVDALTNPEFLLVAGLAASVFLILRHHAGKPKVPLPPGPRGIPFFGNLFQIPALRPAPLFRKWAQKYGPIFHVRIGSQNVIVLNTAEAADEILHNRGNVFSSRIPPHVAHDIMSAGQRLVFLPYSDEWKVARRSLVRTLGPGPSKKLQDVQELESRVLLYDLMHYGPGPKRDPAETEHMPDDHVPEDHWVSHIRRYTTSLVMYATYGFRAEATINNPRMHKIHTVLGNLAQVGQPGNYLADVFPFLRKLPDWLAPWRRDAKRMHAWEMELWGGFLDDIKADMRKGISRPSYVFDYLSQERGEDLDAPGLGLNPDGTMTDMLLAYTAATVLEAGSDTTASTMQSFTLFMLSHPHVLEKVRAEVDRVCGERMPTFDDMENLPYMNACITETMRRRPPTIMGVPHSADEDSVYEGYLIPKGSTVFGNIWSIHMDPKRYVNPEAYIPERWLPEYRDSHGIKPDERAHFVFGWGRRFCQGSYIAEANLFITLSRMIWGLDFHATDRKVPDMADEETTWTTGFVSIPKPFEVTWSVRSEAKAQLIEKEFEAAQAEWDLLNLGRDRR